MACADKPPQFSLRHMLHLRHTQPPLRTTGVHLASGTGRLKMLWLDTSQELRAFLQQVRASALRLFAGNNGPQS